MTPVAISSLDFRDIERRNQSRWIFGISHEASDIAQEHEPATSQSPRDLRCCQVCIGIVGFSVFIQGDWRDDRDLMISQMLPESQSCAP
jgi:hypothetical protein